MMSGWKTWAATIVAVCAGVTRVCQSLLAEPFDANAFYEGLIALAGALGLVGIGHKIEKNKVG